MSVLVVGSVAYDTVVTPTGSRSDALGGSATYFSVACSYFAPVSIVAVVGADFQPAHRELLMSRGVDLSGLETAEGETFTWSGVYSAEDVSARSTLDTQLNVFANFAPSLTAEQRQAPHLFLANIDPNLQRDVLDQMRPRPKLVGLDSMNFWIERKNSSLRSVISGADVLFMDEGEARSMTSEVNLVKSAHRMMDFGTEAVVIKRGGHGVMMQHGDTLFVAPAMPLENVVDPTGAGDAFAGGFIGYLSATGDVGADGFRRAAAVGTVMGSFAVESFSLDRLASLTREDVEGRFREFTELLRFKSIEDGGPLPWR